LTGSGAGREQLVNWWAQIKLSSLCSLVMAIRGMTQFSAHPFRHMYTLW